METRIGGRDVGRDVSVGDDLDGELSKLPRLIWHYGDLEAAAYQLALEAKAHMEQAHATAYKAHKELARKEKVTEAQVSAEVELDPAYRSYVQKWVEAEGNARRLKALMESLRAKKDALIQLSANRRNEMHAGLDATRR